MCTFVSVHVCVCVSVRARVCAGERRVQNIKDVRGISPKKRFEHFKGVWGVFIFLMYFSCTILAFLVNIMTVHPYLYQLKSSNYKDNFTDNKKT